MAISNASRLADFGTGIGTEGAAIQIDNVNQRVGIGTTNPQGTLQVGTGVTIYGNSGIVSATSFYGDGSNLSAVIADSATTATYASTSGIATYAETAGIATNAQGLTGTPNITVGIITASSGEFSGNVSIAGTLTYEDVTNIDSVGLVTARTGVRVTTGGVVVTAGYSTVSDRVYFNNSGNVYFDDSTGAYFGDGIDLQIYHNGSDSIIKENGPGVLAILSNNQVRITNTGYAQTAAVFVPTGQTELFYNNSKKFETTGAGVSIAGVCTATSYFDGRVPQIPQNAQGGAYTLVKSDAGKHINAGGNVTVNASIFDIGDAISVFNDTGGDITIIQGTSVTLRLVADTSTGTRTLASYGLACILCVGSNEFVVSGGGIS